MTEIKPGQELDRAVAEAIGEPGKQYHMASNDGGKSLCASTLDEGCWPTEASLKIWLAEKHAKGMLLDYVTLARHRPERYSTDLNAAFAAAEKVWDGFVVQRHPCGQWALSVFSYDTDEWKPVIERQPTAALAICASILETRRSA